MINKKIIIGIIILALALVIYGVYLWYKTPLQEQPAGESIGAGTEQEQPEISGPEDNNPAGEEESNNNFREEKPNTGGLFICADKCGDAICQSETCTNDMNCPCIEDETICPQDCGE